MKVEVHQIFYEEHQKSHLQPGFTPYDNSLSKPPHNFEYSVFMSSYLSGKVKSALTGFVSWKFTSKTGISGKDFLTFIDNNPGFDVYFINPFPDQACFANVWNQGDFFHPNLTAMTTTLLKKAGYNIDLHSFKNRPDTLCYCNYWVGTPDFWTRYIAFISPLFDYLNNHATTEELASLNVKADKIIEAPYTPFIFERMFSTYIALNSDIKICAYEYNESILKTRYPKIWRLLFFMTRLSKSRRFLPYEALRKILYFRTYGIKKLPGISLLVGLKK